MDEIKSHGKKWLYWFLFAVAVIIVYKALDSFTDVMNAVGTFLGVIAPFLAGIFIAYLLYLPSRRLEQALGKAKPKFISKRARTISVVLVYLIVLLLVIILFTVIVPVLFQSIVDLLNNIPGYIETVIDDYNKLPDDSFWKSSIVNDTITGMQSLDIKQYFQLDKVLEYLSGAISAVFSIIDVFIAIVVSIYVLIQRKQILNFLKRLARAVFKEKTYYYMEKYFNDSNTIFCRFITSQFLDAIVVSVLVSIALTIMGVKYAPVLGIFIGLFNMIPYFGAIIATAIAAIITLITGGLSQAIWMLIVVIILQQIDANIINPKIVGKSLKMSPLLVIFAVTVGGAFFGVLGMFLAVPIIAIIKLLVEDYIDYKNEKLNNGDVQKKNKICSKETDMLKKL